MTGLRSFRTRLDLCQSAGIRCQSQVIIVLKIEPELSGKPEIDAEPKCGIGGDAAIAAHNVMDAWRGHAQFLSEPVGSQPVRLHEFCEKNFSRMDCESSGHCHSFSQW